MWRPCPPSKSVSRLRPRVCTTPGAEHDACGVGFVVHMKGQRSHDIVQKALQVLINLEHRGACGCEANTGDGAGILLQTPDEFLRKVVPFTLPAAGAYGAGLIFLPHQERDREAIKSLIGSIVAEEGATLLGWRDVPTDNRLLGESAVATQPVFQQLFIGSSFPVADRASELKFERKLYVIRKRIENAVDRLSLKNALSRRFFFIVSLSAKTLIYKGMLTARQLVPMFPDLSDPDAEVVRSRSCTSASARTRSRRGRWPIRTATSPTTARSTRCAATSTGCAPAKGCSGATCFGDDLEKILPVIREGGQRHRDLRQRARAARDGRPIAAARHPDDDPGAVAEP